MALFNAIVFLPVLFVLHRTGIEFFDFPDRDQLIILTINGVLGNLVFDYCYMRSVVLLGPLVT